MTTTHRTTARHEWEIAGRPARRHTVEAFPLDGNGDSQRETFNDRNDAIAWAQAIVTDDTEVIVTTERAAPERYRHPDIADIDVLDISWEFVDDMDVTV